MLCCLGICHARPVEKYIVTCTCTSGEREDRAAIDTFPLLLTPTPTPPSITQLYPDWLVIWAVI